MEVEIRASAAPASPSVKTLSKTPISPTRDQSAVNDTQTVMVRVEEVILVALVLLLWVGAIALFFNRWGKIRMLEPYQPKFHQQAHRPSCPLAPLSSPTANLQMSNTLPRTQKLMTQRMSFSKYNVNALTDPLSILPSPIIKRPRRNSVFAGSFLLVNPSPRRVKSATDIHHLGVIANNSTTSLTGSVMPVITGVRRPSFITIERPSERPIFISRRRPSAAVEKNACQYPKVRRSSCFVERVTGGHRNFASFEHPESRTPSTLIMTERRSCSRFHPPTFEIPTGSHTNLYPTDVSNHERTIFKPKISRSFEQARFIAPKPERLVASLDASSTFSINRRCSMPEKDWPLPAAPPLEEVNVTEPLLDQKK